MHVIIVAYHHPLFYCMDVSVFYTSIPRPFNILNKNVLTLVFLMQICSYEPHLLLLLYAWAPTSI